MEIEPQLPPDRPTILYAYPRNQASLARISPDDPETAERFELYIGGMELANAFSELTDSEEQRLRFSEEERARQASGKRPYPSPVPFLTELTAMPAAAGLPWPEGPVLNLRNWVLPDISACPASPPRRRKPSRSSQ